MSIALSTGCQTPKQDSASDSGTSDSSTTAAPTSGTSTEAPTTASTTAPTTGVDDCAEMLVIDGDLVITDATDPAALTCVVEVKGALHLDDTTTWTDVAPLARLERVGNNVTIHRNAGLVSLDGLQKLAHVDGSVAVVQNPLLADISGLSGLRQCAGLGVVENAVTVFDALHGDVTFVSPLGGSVGLSIHEELLTDLDGLATLATVTAPDGLVIGLFEMPALVDASGLEVLAGIEGPLEIHLTDLPALPSFTWPGPLARLYVHRAATLAELALPMVDEAREIVLSDLPQLTSLAGLAALETVVESLQVGRCEAPGIGALDLAGLEGLAQVGQLVIANNPALAGLTGLPTALEAEAALLRDNPQLAQSDAEAWLDAAGLAASPESGACGNLDGPPCAACAVRR